MVRSSQDAAVAQSRGTRAPLPAGGGYLAAQSGLAVVPVALRGCQELYQGKDIIVVIGPPLRFTGAPTSPADQEAFAARVQEAVAALMPSYQEAPPAHTRLRFLTNLFG